MPLSLAYILTIPRLVVALVLGPEIPVRDGATSDEPIMGLPRITHYLPHPPQHRMGLQYFEALSPATISSIVAVLCNRLVVGNDVTGYYSYPFLTATLPSEIFTSAILFGLYGAGVGTLYAHATKFLKVKVHDLFHAPHVHEHKEPDHDGPGIDGEHDAVEGSNGEKHPLLSRSHARTVKMSKRQIRKSPMERLRGLFCFAIPNEAVRAPVAGVIAGFLVGWTCVFVPHAMFWGEAQLQNLIDRGRTPLPIFGRGDEPTAGLTARGLCMVDHDDPAAVKDGFPLGCALLISVAKIVTTGLSLGTGIIAGHFWGPLFVGCSAAHLLTDLANICVTKFGFGGSLATYPCVAILCTMGSTHVVTFRAHMAIMLILTLTISAFNPEDDVGGEAVAGDYSAVFPLLVVSVFVSLMASRGTVFYPTQRSRGDITAVPEVLCEPGVEGRPMMEFESGSYEGSDDYFSEDGDGDDHVIDRAASSDNEMLTVPQILIEKDFEATLAASKLTPSPPFPAKAAISNDSRSTEGALLSASDDVPLSLSGLDELLARPMELPAPAARTHRRIHSAPSRGDEKAQPRPRTDSSPQRPGITRESSDRSVVRVTVYGEVKDRLSLMDQARAHAASSAEEARHHRIRSLGHVRHNSDASDASRRAGHVRHGSDSSYGEPSSTKNATSNPLQPPSSVPRHRRKNSDPTLTSPSAARPVQQHSNPTRPPKTGRSPAAQPSGSGALTMDDIEQSFNSTLERLAQERHDS